MIKRIDISGIHYKLEPGVKNYVYEKIGKLDRFIDKHAQNSVHAEVKLKSSYHKNRHQHICEVILHMPREIIRLQESEVNMPAAIDLVQARLKNRLKKYKETHKPARGRRFLRQLAKQIRRSGR